MMPNSFDAKATLTVGGRRYEIFRLDALQAKYDVARLPFSLKVLLENLLRNEDGESIRAQDIEALAKWDAKAEPATEIAFTPARVIMQDFTGVPAVVDLAAMRDAMREMGGDPRKINPLAPAELVIDHSVQVDVFGSPRGVRAQRRARVRAQPRALRVPALGPGRVRQLSASSRPTPGSCTRSTSSTWRGWCSSNDEARTGLPGHAGRHRLAHHDDQRARRARLGRRRDRGRGGDARPADVDADPAGARLQADRLAAGGRDGHRPGADRHRDAAPRGVVGKFVEFYGEGLARLPLADRATIGNMSPEFGSTCAIFPIDAETLRYLEFSGRPPRADRAGRGVRARAGAVARRGLRGADVHRHARARSLDRGARASPGPSARRTASR